MRCALDACNYEYTQQQQQQCNISWLDSSSLSKRLSWFTCKKDRACKGQDFFSCDCFWRSAKAMFCSRDGGARSVGILFGMETPIKLLVLSTCCCSSVAAVGDTVGVWDEAFVSAALSDGMLLDVSAPVMVDRLVSENVRTRFAKYSWRSSAVHVNLQSIIRRNSRSNMLSSAIEMPPTLA